MEYQNLIILPLTGLFIGWLTNWLAIKFLFWPEKKVLGIQGLVPRRKEMIAEKIAGSALKILPSKLEMLTKVPILGQKIAGYIKKEVSEKVKSMDNNQLQKIIQETARKELRFIELSGAVLGFLIGVVQALILEVI